jgi:hypothetical protein
VLVASPCDARGEFGKGPTTLGHITGSIQISVSGKEVYPGG